MLSYIARDPSAIRLRNIAVSGLQESAYAKSLSRYANYLNYRILGFRELGYDPIAASFHGIRLRHLTVAKGLLRETSVIQKVARALLECSFFSDERQDELTQTALQMVLKDLLVLFMIINEGVINILEHYFEMSKPDAERALELYKRFVWQTERVVAYLKATRKVSYALKMNVPRLQHAPVSLASSLEEYLNDPNFERNRAEYLENKKGTGAKAGDTSKGQGSNTTDDGKRDNAPKENGDNQASSTDTNAKKDDQATSRVPAAASGNKALEDFFEALEGGPSNAFNSVHSFGGADPFSLFMMPQATGPFPTPQMAAPPFITPQIGTMPTPFMGPVTPMMPQSTGNPFTQMQPQLTGNPFGVPMSAPVGSPIGAPTGAPFGGPPSMFDSVFGIQSAQSTPFAPQSNSSSSAYANHVVDEFLGINNADEKKQDGDAQNNSKASTSPPVSSPSRAPSEQPPAPQPPAPAPSANLRPQRTGFQNPFSIPSDFEPPPEPPAPKGPTLHELAMEAWTRQSGTSPQEPQATQPPAQPQTQPQQQSQPTGMTNVSSELLRPQATGMPQIDRLTITQQTTSVPELPTPGTTSNQPPPSSPAPLTIQTTGLGSLRTFKPESQFGNLLAKNTALSSPIQKPAHTGNPFSQQGPFTPVGLGIGPQVGPREPARSASLFPATTTQHPPIRTMTLGPQATGATSLSPQATGAGSLGAPQQTSPFSQPQGAPSLTSQNTGLSGLKPFQPTSAFGTSLKNQPATQDLLQL